MELDDSTVSSVSFVFVLFVIIKSVLTKKKCSRVKTSEITNLFPERCCGEN